MADSKDKAFFKEWLEKLQQESWQLELLISGLALFGIYESRNLINDLSLYSEANYTGLINELLNFLEIVLSMGWYIFFFNLLIHVVLRGLWIGAIGLRYVSEEIDYEELKYSRRFTELLKKRVGDFDDFIERLERICSVLFAYTFLLFLLFFSLMLFFFEVAILAQLGDWLFGSDSPFFIFPALFFFFLGLLVFFDFMTMGVLKKVEESSVSKVFVVLFKFYSFMTLSFLYAPILYNFLDNKYTRRLFFVSIPLFAGIFFLPNLIHKDNYNYNPSSKILRQHGKEIQNHVYDDLRREYYAAYGNPNRQKYSLPLFTINEFINDEPYLKMFLKMEPADAEQLERESDVSPFYESGVNFSINSRSIIVDSAYIDFAKPYNAELAVLRKQRRALRKVVKKNDDDVKQAQIASIEEKIDSVSTILEESRKLLENKRIDRMMREILSLSNLSIDGNDIKTVCDCYFRNHPNNDERGLMCLYPMDSLDLGKHILEYKKKRTRLSSQNKVNDRSFTQSVPFYRVRKVD